MTQGVTLLLPDTASPSAIIDKGLVVEYEALPGWLRGYASYYFSADPVFVLNDRLQGLTFQVGYVLGDLLAKRARWVSEQVAAGQPTWFPVQFVCEEGEAVEPRRFTTASPAEPYRLVGVAAD